MKLSWTELERKLSEVKLHIRLHGSFSFADFIFESSPLLLRWTPCSRCQLPLLQATPGPLAPLCLRPLHSPLQPCPPQPLSSWRWGRGPLAPTPRMEASQGLRRGTLLVWGPVSQGPASTWRASSGMRRRKVRSVFEKSGIRRCFWDVIGFYSLVEHPAVGRLVTSFSVADSDGLTTSAEWMRHAIPTGSSGSFALVIGGCNKMRRRRRRWNKLKMTWRPVDSTWNKQELTMDRNPWKIFLGKPENLQHLQQRTVCAVDQRRWTPAKDQKENKT